jgi:hypothetical protein
MDTKAKTRTDLLMLLFSKMRASSGLEIIAALVEFENSN